MDDESYSRLAARRFREYLKEERERMQNSNSSTQGNRGQATLYTIIIELIKLSVQFLQSVGVIKKKRSERVAVE